MDKSERNYKSQVYEQFARIGKAFSNANRLELLNMLSHGEYSVEELARETGMTIANTSQHLQSLRSSHLVETRRQGSKTKCRLASDEIIVVLDLISKLADELLAHLDRVIKPLMEERKKLKLRKVEEILASKSQQFVILDVRPEREYIAAHIPQAISIPLSVLEERITEIAKKQEIVVYCRGYYSDWADKAVNILISHGFNASRLELGFSEWKIQGLPINQELVLEGVKEASV